MGIYNVHGGHNFIVPGAKGFLDETTEDRKVTARLIQTLRSAGHTVYDCTDNSGRTQGKILSNIVAKCNAQKFSNQHVDGIPGKNTLAGCPICQKGAKGNITKLIQEKLNSLGYNCSAVDGIFGNETKKAVTAFQKKHGLSADGIVGKNTWKVLLYS